MAAKAAPDGYTLVMIGAAHAINVTLYPKLNYDVRRDFAPVALLTVAPMVVITNAAFPAKTLPELVALAKQQPGRIAYASAGNGTAPHLAMELLKSQSGADLLHVPYRGSAPGMADVLAGQLPVTVDSIVAALQNVGSGKLRLLAVTGAHRSPMAPDVPTVGEVGYPGAQSSVWYGIAAPAQTLPAILARLNEEIGKVLADPDIRKRLADFGAEPSPMAPESFGAFIGSEIEKWAAAVKSSGARID
jgi:tripartite-type tricarboxylate transporter receptor subunit TctC